MNFILLFLCIIIIWATSWENLFMPYANNKGADQHAHPRSHPAINIYMVYGANSPWPIQLYCVMYNDISKAKNYGRSTCTAGYFFASPYLPLFRYKTEIFSSPYITWSPYHLLPVVLTIIGNALWDLSPSCQCSSPFCLSLTYCSVYLGYPCGHLLRKSCPFGFSLVLFIF